MTVNYIVNKSTIDSIVTVLYDKLLKPKVDDKIGRDHLGSSSG